MCTSSLVYPYLCLSTCLKKRFGLKEVFMIKTERIGKNLLRIYYTFRVLTIDLRAIFGLYLVWNLVAVSNNRVLKVIKCKGHAFLTWRRFCSLSKPSMDAPGKCLSINFSDSWWNISFNTNLYRWNTSVLPLYGTMKLPARKNDYGWLQLKFYNSQGFYRNGNYRFSWTGIFKLCFQL